MMRVSLVSLCFTACLSLSAPFVSAGRTYWVDSTCNDGVKDAISQSVWNAGRASTRLKDVDANTAAFVKRIFQLDTSAQADAADLNTIKDRFGVIAGLTLVEGDDKRAGSDVRIYCDEDRMWVPVPDVEDPNAPKNSERSDDTKEYEDRVNFFRLPAGGIKRVCGESHSNGLAISIANEFVSPNSPATENPERQMITICDKGFEFLFGIDDLTVNDICSGDCLMYFDSWLPQTLIHEYTHLAWAGDTEDSHGTDKRSGYGWDKLLALARAETLENADSYSYFATMCLLLDRQWKLPDSDDDQKAGKMVQDTSLPLLKGNDVPIYIPPDNAGNTAQSKTQQPPAKAPAVSPVAVASQSRKRASILTCRDPSAMVVEGRCVEFVS